MKDSRLRVGMMYTGGKDSTFACTKLLENGYRPVCLITIHSENKESYMLHTAGIETTELSSQAIGLPLIKGYTKGAKEEELKDIKETMLLAKKEYQLEAIGTGALASKYQKYRIDSIASECGLSVLSPLWGMDQKNYLKSIVASGYRFILTSVSCEGLDSSWLGREVTMDALNELEQLASKYRFNIAFEGGEAETLVLDCPLFKTKKLAIVDSEVEWNGYFGVLNIRHAVLENK